MNFWLLLFLIPLPVYVTRASDPAPGVWQTRQDARNYECVTLDQARAHELYPSQVPELPARRTGFDHDALVCSARYLKLDERPARHEAILATLRASTTELAQAAGSAVTEDLLWHVDAFYPDVAVGAKIAVATRMELAERGHKVSDRVPILGAGDVSVLSTLPAAKAYPLACARYFAEHSLSDHDALLGLMVVDPRETQLHAGVCVHGAWKWLR